MWNTEIKNRYLMIFLIFLTWFLTGFLTFVNLAKNSQSVNLSNIDLWSSILSQNSDLNLTNFNKVYRLIKNNYYSNGEIDNETLVDGAIKWMVESLWDIHSEYFPPKENQAFSETLTWSFEWIWAYVSKVPEWIRIDSIMKGSPAKKFWILPWDIIVKAWDEELKDLDKYEAISKIKWPAGSSILLTIYRSGEKELLEKEVVRTKIDVPTVHSEIKDNIWYISVNIFAQNTALEFKKELDSLTNKKVEGIVIDLRQNWWGYLTQAIIMLSNFIDSGEILVRTRSKSILDGSEVYKSQDLWEDKTTLPIVVLIDESSASASEITAWAIKDYERWIIVWVKSYGKWSVQHPYSIWENRLVKITTSKWFTPKDYNIDWKWINPDIEVKFDIEDAKKWIDNQKEKAFEIMKKLILEKNTSKVIGLYNNDK